ncbi:universal stress protein [Streptomyces erythrochromogenes]|uniref:universal stress protein n=1 Tax=Streptomyces erythrochromogenes TaxID=285574 RepID=UPI0036CA0225
MKAESGVLGRVVVGVTGSLASLAALRHGLAEARRDGRTLVAVLAWEPPEGEALFAQRPDRAWAKMWAETSRAQLKSAFHEALGGVPADLPVELRVVRGAPGPVLCAVASRTGDLLVVGTARKDGLAMRLRRRPVSRFVLAKSQCPVLAVPAPELLPGEARVLRKVAYFDPPGRPTSARTGLRRK